MVKLEKFEQKLISVLHIHNGSIGKKFEPFRGIFRFFRFPLSALCLWEASFHPHKISN